MTNAIKADDERETAISVESALKKIIEMTLSSSHSDRVMRNRIRSLARNAIEQIELGRLSGVDVVTAVFEGLPVAWLHVWANGSREVEATLADDRYGLSEAIPLTFMPNGPPIAWRWGNGEGRNASPNYSFVDPLENWEEVELCGATSVVGCRPLFAHPTVRSYNP